ncbi:MAG: bestrophin family ion channel [Polyangiales bacterium]
MIDYDPHRWRDNFLDLHGTMFKTIAYRSFYAMVAAALVTFLYERVLKFPPTDRIHALIGTALSLLLVFRTNASYDRFWEARKLWGAIVNESRNLARSSSVLLSSEPDLVSRVVWLAAAFPYACMHALRGSKAIGPLEREMPPEVSAGLTAAQHVPLAITARMSAAVNEARLRGAITDIQQSMIDQNAQLLIDYIGGCERIRKTPLPFAYVIHLRRALAIYCGTLPLALVSSFHWWTLPITLLVSFILLGIEEIGVEIEEPFGTDANDLPLDAICATIEANVKAFLPAPTAPAPAPEVREVAA